MIKFIQIFGERCSGTNYLASLVRKNFRNTSVITDFGGKHWFIKDHLPRGPKNTTTDNQCVRSLSDSDDTLFLVIYRNPYDWVRSIHRSPYHAYGHMGLDFSTFVRKPWLSFETRKMHQTWQLNPGMDYFIEESESVLTLRTQKVAHLNALVNKVNHISFLNYEALCADVNLLAEVAQRHGIAMHQEFIVNDPIRKGWAEKKRVGYVPVKQREISVSDLEFIKRNLNWDLEQGIGYNAKDYDRGSFKASVPVHLSHRDDATSNKVSLQLTSQKNNSMTRPDEQDLIELTVFVRGMEPLILSCSIDQPIVETLFTALTKNSLNDQSGSGELLFLEIGEDPPKAIYFPRDRLIAIESSPPLGQEFLQNLAR